MKKTWTALTIVALLSLGLAPLALADGHTGPWKGEVLDLACYVAHESHGAEHKGCAKSCVKGGQPMGLLTESGEVYLLAADHGDGKPFEALKDLAGEQAEVTGTVAEKGGMKVITVTGSKAAG